MKDLITKRVAITEVDFDKVQIGWIMKIFESIIDKKLLSIKLYVSKLKKPFAIAEFNNENDAKEIYDFCDGIEIEDLKETFNLSFVPENAVFENPQEECYNCKEFRFEKLNFKSIKSANDIIDVSNESFGIDVDVPESFNFEASLSSNDSDTIENIKENSSIELLDKSLYDSKEDTALDLSEFIFDAQDERFKKLYTDDNYNVDASSYKFKKNPSLRAIIEEKRKKYKNEQ